MWRKLIFLKYFIAYFVTSFSIAVLVKPKTLAAMVVPGRSYFIVMSDQTLFTFHEYVTHNMSMNDVYRRSKCEFVHSAI